MLEYQDILIVFLSALGLMIIGNILESNGTLKSSNYRHQRIDVLTLAYFTLFCVMIFAFVRLVIRFFVFMQIKIGNGELFLVKLLQAREQAVFYGCWIMMVIGFGIIFFLGKDAILKDFKWTDAVYTVQKTFSR
jgi:hypothetical protein